MQQRKCGIRAKRIVMPSKHRSNVDNVDRFGVEEIGCFSKLVCSVIMSVDELIGERSSEEEEERRGKTEGGIFDGKKELGFGGEREGDGEFTERGTDMGFSAAGEPANESEFGGGRAEAAEEDGVDLAGGVVEGG